MTNSMIHTSQHPMVAYKLSQLRDKNQSPKTVRELIGDLSTLLAYEATTDISLSTNDQTVNNYKYRVYIINNIFIGSNTSWKLLSCSSQKQNRISSCIKIWTWSHSRYIQ